MEVIRTYEPHPTDMKKSFYGKAYVEVLDNGDEILYSYGTKIMTHNGDKYVRHKFTPLSTTTLRHIKAFSGLNKKEFLELEVE